MNVAFRRAAVVLLLTGVAVPASAQAPDAKSIIERYEKEIGVAGSNPYKDVHSIRTKMHLSTPAMGMEFDMQIDAVLPDRFESRMTIPGMGEVRSGYDGAVAWTIDPMQGPRVLHGAELDQARSQATDITRPGISAGLSAAETVGEDAVDGRKCWVVKMTQISGVIADGCFDAENGLLVKQTLEQGGSEIESFFHDYKAFGPVKMASRIVARSAGMEQIITIESVEYNAIDPALLALPPEVKALIRS